MFTVLIKIVCFGHRNHILPESHLVILPSLECSWWLFLRRGKTSWTIIVLSIEFSWNISEVTSYCFPPSDYRVRSHYDCTCLLMDCPKSITKIKSWTLRCCNYCRIPRKCRNDVEYTLRFDVFRLNVIACK